MTLKSVFINKTYLIGFTNTKKRLSLRVREAIGLRTPFLFFGLVCVWEEYKMKKLFALFVMAIFLISLVPAAFAVQGDGQGGTQAASTLYQEQTQARQVRADQIGERMGSMRERYQAVRERYAQNKEQMRARLTQAKEKRAEAKAKHQEARQKIQERKEKLNSCKGSETEDCRKTRKETKRHTKTYLSNVAEHVMGLIAKTKERVEASNMPEDQKAEILAKLDENAVKIASAAESVEELGEESAKEDYVEAAKLIRESWKDTKKSIKNGAGKVAANKIRALNTRMEQLQTKLRRTVQRLENAGEDVTPVKAQLAEFEAKLSQSKAAEQEAQSKYQAGDIAGAVEKTKEAHRYLLEAHKALKQFVRNMKQIRGGEKALRERAREREQESDEDADEAGEEEAEETEGNETIEDSDDEGNETSTEDNETEGNETA